MLYTNRQKNVTFPAIACDMKKDNYYKFIYNRIKIIPIKINKREAKVIQQQESFISRNSFCPAPLYMTNPIKLWIKGCVFQR